MVIQVEDVKKENRKYFREELLKKGVNIVSFADDNARVEIRQAYFINEQELKRISEIKKAVYNFITDFRHYQFNKSLK